MTITSLAALKVFFQQPIHHEPCHLRRPNLLSPCRFVVLLAWLAAFQLSAEDCAAEDPWFAAERAADAKIQALETAVKSGDTARIQSSALDLQADPIAVRRFNKNSPDALKTQHNEVTEGIKKRTRELVRQKIVQEYKTRGYDVDPKKVTFFEATNPPKPGEVKVGQDWDITVRVDGVDVPHGISKGPVREAYYEAVHNRPPPSPEAAKDFAHRQALEVTSYQHPEAYGGAQSEGGQIISGDKGQRLRDPAQLGNTVEYKSNVPGNQAAALEAQGRSADAQSLRLEQCRQHTKQFDRQIEPRVEAMGGTVPPQIEEGVNILRKVEMGEMTPTQAREALAKIGETPESIIRKSSSLIEAAHTLKPAGERGPPPKSVFEENVVNRLRQKGIDVDNLAAGKVKGVVGEGIKAIGAADIANMIGNTAQDIVDVVQGKKDLKDAALDAANGATLGIVSTYKDLGERGFDVAAAEIRTREAQAREDEARALEVGNDLRNAGVSPEETRRIMDAMRDGDDGPATAKVDQLKAQGRDVTIPERTVVEGVTADDTLGDRAAEVVGGMKDSTVRAGKFFLDVPNNLAEIAGSAYDAATTHSETDRKREAQKDEKQALINKFIEQGADPARAKDAADSLFDAGNTQPARTLGAELRVLKDHPEMKNLSPTKRQDQPELPPEAGSLSDFTGPDRAELALANAGPGSQFPQEWKGKTPPPDFKGKTIDRTPFRRGQARDDATKNYRVGGDYDEAIRLEKALRAAEEEYRRKLAEYRAQQDAARREAARQQALRQYQAYLNLLAQQRAHQQAQQQHRSGGGSHSHHPHYTIIRKH